MFVRESAKIVRGREQVQQRYFSTCFNFSNRPHQVVSLSLSEKQPLFGCLDKPLREREVGPWCGGTHRLGHKSEIGFCWGGGFGKDYQPPEKTTPP